MTKKVDKKANASDAPSRTKENGTASATKKRKLSSEYVSGDEIDDRTKYNLEEKLKITRYDAQFVRFLDAKEFNLRYFQENGFETPLVFKDKSGLGLRVPSENFKVSDVKACVGSKRIVDVLDVGTQKGLTMTMKDWCAYYESPARDSLLNVISLEFSHTKLENYVEAPNIVRQIDWIDTAWPKSLIEAHTESTNLMDKMKYPKVQKYVLMSVAGCYTDFHIDMGGSSVWYHILKGAKVFWLIPPTDRNLKIYEQWTLSGEQSTVFLPDLVDDCQRIELQKGWTFMLPSGWIHGVYTKEDSLVFGGNFLHSFNIPMQIKVHNIELKTKVPVKHRYPFFFEIMWFVLERYIHCLTGVTHLTENLGLDDLNASDVKPNLNERCRQTFSPTITPQHLTKYEFEGIEAIYSFMKGFASTKRQVPKEIVEPDSLLHSIEKLLKHKLIDESTLHITGTPIAHWPKPEKKFLKKAKPTKAEKAQIEIKDECDEDEQRMPQFQTDTSGIKHEEEEPSKRGKGKPGQGTYVKRKHNMRDIPRTKGSIKKRLRPVNIPRSTVERRRRVRCHKCEPCTRDDCGECKYCKDMKKFGGTGISKQCCLSKQCLAPLLPTTSDCMYCNGNIDRKNRDPDYEMFECEICFEIYHLGCYRKKYESLTNIESIVNEDLANCWTCSNCIYKGFHEKLEKTKQECSGTKTNTSSLNDSFSQSKFEIDFKSDGDDTTDDSDLDRHDPHSISLDSLSNREKKIILSEFCEIYNEADESCQQNYGYGNGGNTFGLTNSQVSNQESSSSNNSNDEPTTISQMLHVM